MREIKSICVIGGGTMGRQIALNAAIYGFKANLYVRRPEKQAEVTAWMEDYMAGRIKKGRLTPEQVDAAKALFNVIGDFNEAVSGVDCVIAKTFARIFYRNAINIGLPILECPEAGEKIQAGDVVSIDFDTGVITNETKQETYQALPFPDFIKDIMAKGGLMNSLKEK